jgi:1-pyrroline-5-carboxylate dehydrogenase
MSDAIFRVPPPINEPVKSYAPGSPERAALQAEVARLRAQEIEIPMYINGKEVFTDDRVRMHPPYEIAHTLGNYSKGDKSHVEAAIASCLAAKPRWEALPWQERAAIFLKAADLVAGPYRARINAATMLGQSKNAHQAEIDASCELIDFWRYNALFMQEIYQMQPVSSPNTWNKVEYRPLEGFVFALTPFNFTAIAGNLPTAPAMLGNVAVWKPADTQIYSAQVIMEVLMEAGLPDGVINMVYGDGPMIGDVIFKHREFAGLHFTGSTGVFQKLWKTIGDNISTYKSYPRIVGETGGKDFIVAHGSANPKAVAVALVRGAFEFQGQKCSAASRAYVAKSIWKTVKKEMLADLADMKLGSPETYEHFVNAVIDERAFDKIAKYINQAKKSDKATIISGGGFSKKVGYFIEPTVIETTDPSYTTMCEEIFGPVLTIYVYDDKKWSQTLELVNNTSPYALTGAVLATDRYAVQEATLALRHAAGNFYINDKPTGAVVGQQPFGGGRASGTNDKAGSILNMLRWVSPRTIKENTVPIVDYKYPFLGK